MRQSREYTVAVAGQPNCGKSTTFNALTGARQFVANYPGVTVEKRIGSFDVGGDRLTVVDLPGTYSLTSYSLEERVACDFLLDERPDVVLDVIDASNLERNLYLTFQLLEMELRLVIALNMMDIASGRGLDIDVEQLSDELGVPVVPTVSNRGRGRQRLRQALHRACVDSATSPVHGFRVDYGESLESHLAALERDITQLPGVAARHPARWLAVKLLEGDPEAIRRIAAACDGQGVH
jgi:ferrous iron transport protein B